MGKLTIKLWNYVLKGKKFEQSCISDWLSVLADISDPLSVIGISAKFHIGASLVALYFRLLHELPLCQLHDFWARKKLQSTEVWTHKATDVSVTAVGTCNCLSLTSVVGWQGRIQEFKKGFFLKRVRTECTEKFRVTTPIFSKPHPF